MEACKTCVGNEKKDSVTNIKKENSTVKKDFGHLMRFVKDSRDDLSPENVAAGFDRMDSNDQISLLSELQQTHGNQYMQRVLGAQAKLKISKPSDIYEQEADRVAEQVMRMPEPGIQRKCVNNKGHSTKLGEKKGIVQLKADQSVKGKTSAPDNVLSGLGQGQPLDDQVRAYMEPKFGIDLSPVRVHHDSQAAESAHSINAVAFITGNDIIFGANQYRPHTIEGQRLLAHELAHFMQQEDDRKTIRRMAACPERLKVTDPDPPGWKPYKSTSWFHCGFRVILEDRKPTKDNPINECAYDEEGKIVDEHHPFAGCRGTPDYYDAHTNEWSDKFKHFFIDPGGPVACGGPAFITSQINYRFAGDAEIRNIIFKADSNRIIQFSKEEKILFINRLLDGWVSDADINAIKKIYQKTPSDQQPEVKKAIEDRIHELKDIGQRTQIRGILSW